MKEIEENNLREIEGGGFSWFAVGIGVAITFIIGLISGYTNPNKCNN